MTTPGTKDKCQTCSIQCTDPKVHLTDKKGIRCTGCSHAYHWECEGISKEDFAKLKSMKNNYYLCRTCRESGSSGSDDNRILTKMEVLIDKLLDRKLERIESSILSINSRLDKIEQRPTTDPKRSGDMASFIAKEVSMAMTREKSVIISGIKESSSNESTERQAEDKRIIKGVLQSMGLDKSVTNVFRLGKRMDGKNRPIKLTTSSQTEAKELVEASRATRPVYEGNNIYFNHDLPINQRQEWNDYRKYKKSCMDGNMVSFTQWT